MLINENVMLHVEIIRSSLRKAWELVSLAMWHNIAKKKKKKMFYLMIKSLRCCKWLLAIVLIPVPCLHGWLFSPSLIFVLMLVGSFEPNPLFANDLSKFWIFLSVDLVFSDFYTNPELVTSTTFVLKILFSFTNFINNQFLHTPIKV